MALVEVRNLVKHFSRGGGLFRESTVVRAVDDVSFSVDEGETFALVGESGSGKSTTGRCMLRLVEPTSGEVLFRGENVLGFSSARMRSARRDMQMVFQDPYSSLNPRMRAFAIVEEPLVIHGLGSKSDRRARVADLFRLVGLDPAHLDRFPHEFSGGQRQRIGLARALALNPSFIIADEPVSALDVSIQAQVINLLMELQAQLRLTYLFIAHDLRLVRHISNRVAVMYLGKIVEMGRTEEIFGNPHHAYTQALLSAVPATDPDAPRARIELDPKQVNRDAPLKQVSEGHFAAVEGRHMTRWLTLGVAFLLASTPTSSQPDTSDGRVLNLMHSYLRSYEPELSSVIADERFDQKFVSVRSRNVSKGTVARVKRTIESEVSFVRLPGQNEWLGFRDVRMVDGRPLRRPGLSLVELLQRGGDVLEQARAIAFTGAAQNLGLPRTINIPTAVLEIVHPSHRARFRYTSGGTGKLRGTTAAILMFEETVRPTVVRQPNGGNIVSSGRAWIETGTGRILRVEWFYDSEPHDPAIAVRPKLVVDFEFNQVLGFLVPTRMEEVFGVPYGTGDGVAVYRNFRRFGTSARIVPQ